MYKHRNWIKTLALEPETAILQLPIFEQDFIRYQVAHNIKQLYKQHKDKHNTIHVRKEKKTINKIKKLMTNKTIISKPDKGSSIIITYQNEYPKKVINFLSKNNFTFAKNDLTKKFQGELRRKINEWQKIKTIDGNTEI